MMGKVYYKKKYFCEYIYTLKKLQARNKNGSTLGKPFFDNFNNFTKVLFPRSLTACHSIFNSVFIYILELG